MTAPRKKTAPPPEPEETVPEPEEVQEPEEAAQAPARDILDLARELRYAWDVACAAIPFPAELADRPGVVADGAGDPRYAVIINARHVAYERALTEISDSDSALVTKPWMITALRNGIIPGPGDGTLPGSEAVPDSMEGRL